jgi:hypothetical protein
VTGMRLLTLLYDYAPQVGTPLNQNSILNHVGVSLCVVSRDVACLGIDLRQR